MADFLYPYPSLSVDLSLRALQVAIDGDTQDPGYLIDSANDAVRLDWWDGASWATSCILFEAGPSLSTLAQAEPDVAGLALHLMFECAETGYREVFPVDGEQVEVSLRFVDCRDRCDVTLFATATIDGVAPRVVGTSGAWSVYVDRVAPPLARTPINVVWVDFTDPAQQAHPLLGDHPKHQSFLVPSTREPTLFLNHAIGGLEELLDDRQRPVPAERALHDALRSSIAASAWAGLLVDAIGALEAEPDGEVDLHDVAGEWRRDLLQHFLDETGRTTERGARDLCEAWRDPLRVGDVVGEVHLLASALGQQPKLVARALRELDKADSRKDG
jgi:hypothetical protein